MIAYDVSRLGMPGSVAGVENIDGIGAAYLAFPVRGN